MRSSLTLERVRQAALTLVDREGLEALTMRRLAAELGVDAMSIYRYADGKDALLDGLVDQVMARLAVDPTQGDWRGQLHAVADSFRALALAHPDVLPLIVTRPLVTPLVRRPSSVLRRTEDVLDLLCRAGFDDATAVTAYRRFLGYLLGQLLLELREAVDNGDESDPVLRLGLHRLPLADFPRLRALASAMTDYDAREELHRGLDALLDTLPAPTPAIEERENLAASPPTL